MWRKYGKHHLIFFLVLYPVSGHLFLGYRSNELNVRNNRSSETNRKEINNFIYNLQYDPNQVLAYKTQSYLKVKKQGILYTDNCFAVISRERKTIWNSKTDIGVVSNSEHRIYPGSLLLANYHLIDSNPDYLFVQRAPAIYTVNLPGMTSAGSFRIVPTFANFEAAINKVLWTWFEKYAQNTSVNALFQSDYSFAHSKDQLRVKFGSEFRLTPVEANIDFDAVDRQEKLIMIHKFQQIFYTVSVQSPRTPAELFDKGVTRKELASRINNNNPPVMVDSVSYGRLIYVKMETTSTDDDAKYLLETKLSKLNIEVGSEIEYRRRLKNFNVQVYVQGGSSGQIDLVNANNLKDVNDIIVKYGKFSRTNLAYPILYSTEFIQDNSKAVVKGLAEYTESRKTVNKGGLIKVSQGGGYVSQWEIKWDEVTYDEYGNEKKEQKRWGKNWDDILAPFDGEIELKGNCENICVFARECTGLIWEWWRKIFSRSGLSLHKLMKFSIWGTTLNPHYSVDLTD